MIDKKNPANDRDNDWNSLAAMAQKGDKKAYNLLLKEIVPFIRGVVTPSVANPVWVDDIVQEVLISVHKSLQTFSPDRPFKPWLHSIIHFRRTDFLRKYYKNKSDKSTTMEDQNFISEHVTKPTHSGELKDIEAALDVLPEKQRKLFTLMKVEGYTAQEVADQTGMSVSAVKVSVHRTANKLKEILEEDYD